MSNFNIVRAWKDESYRSSLSSTDQALLPDNPAGSIELSDELLEGVVAGLEQGQASWKVFTYGCCQGDQGTNAVYSLACCDPRPSVYVSCPSNETL